MNHNLILTTIAMLAILLAGAGVIRWGFKSSVTETILLFVREFSAIADKKWSAEAINAVGVISIVSLTAAFFFFSSIFKFFGAAQGDSIGVSYFEFIGAIVVIGFMSLLCVRMCFSRKP